MKRLFVLLMLSAMMVSFVVSLIGSNDNLETEAITVQEDSIMGEQRIISYAVLQNKIESKSQMDTAIENMNIDMSEIENIIDKQEWFIAYKKIIDKYSYILDPPETIYDYYTDEEINIMLRCIETEAFDQSFESKINVASVILNRISDEKFPDNPIDVVASVNQFAYWRTDISDDTILALEYAFEIEDTTNGSLFFHSNNWSEMFNNAEYVFTDESNHHFYR